MRWTMVWRAVESRGPGPAHLGLSLWPVFRGSGLGADMVLALCEYGFAVRGLHRLQVDTLVSNTAMMRAASRAGFVREGMLRGAAWVDGEFADEVILGLLASEWEAGRTAGCGRMPPGG
jgi:RimJ/RimL family protein N-acetyltransferase